MKENNVAWKEGKKINEEKEMRMKKKLITGGRKKNVAWRRVKEGNEERK